MTWEKFLSINISKPLLGGGGVILSDGGGGQQRHLVCTPTLVAEPIGTPEDPQSAAVRRTTNKCCQKPKQDFSPQPKQDFSPVDKRISY